MFRSPAVSNRSTVDERASCQYGRQWPTAADGHIRRCWHFPVFGHAHRQHQCRYVIHSHTDGTTNQHVAAAATATATTASSVSGNGMPSQMEPATLNTAGIPPEIVPVAQRFFAFTNKVYMRGLLNKKNDIMPDGKPFSIRDWTAWYVELRGPVLTFWTTAELADDAARLQLLQDSQSLELHKAQTIPNYINITDSVADVVGTLEDRQFVLSLNTAGANRFYLEATGPQVMLAWVRCIRLA
ncbi:hypothetical protein BJ085DRAFT_36527, partial [Dimargaris cristalligena]